MYKEIIIFILVVLIVLGFDFVTQKYTKNAIDVLSKDLLILKDDLIKNKLNPDEFLSEYDKVHSKWNVYNDKLSFYIEHSELEKVNTSFVMCKSLIESNELSQAISELEKAIFLLKHIGDKYDLNLLNIF